MSLLLQQERNMQNRNIHACRNVRTALSRILTHFVSSKPTTKGNVQIAFIFIFAVCLTAHSFMARSPVLCRAV